MSLTVSTQNEKSKRNEKERIGKERPNDNDHFQK